MRKGLPLCVISLICASPLVAQTDIPAKLPDGTVQPKAFSVQAPNGKLPDGTVQPKVLSDPPANGIEVGPRVRYTSHTLQLWGSAEYLRWWLKSGSTPPLVTTGNPTDTVPGALGQPGTSTLFGGPGAIDYNGASGFRGTIGIALDGGWGVEFSGMWFQNQNLTFSRVSDVQGNPPTYVPFFRDNPLVGPAREGSYTIADPLLAIPPNPNAGPAFGRIDIEATTRFSAFEVNAVRKYALRQNCALDFLFGYRHGDLDESLTFSGFTSNLITAANPNAVDIRQDFREAFTTRNRFDGGQIGLGLSWTGSRFSFDVLSKVALGYTSQTVNASGSLTESGGGILINPPGPNSYTNQGAPFVFPSNIGQRSERAFSVIPQVMLQLGYNLTPNCRATIGYDFLYWTNVVRPGDQIDRRVNDSQATLFNNPTGTLVPVPQFNRTDFFAHGINVGLSVRY